MSARHSDASHPLPAALVATAVVRALLAFRGLGRLEGALLLVLFVYLGLVVAAG